MQTIQIDSIHTEITGHYGDQFIDALMDFYEGHRDDITLDFIGIDYMSSIAMATIGRLHAHMQDDGKELILIHISPKLFQLFELTGLVELLNLTQEA
ncbi:MAG: STAS domain-containing protein [Planctomycetota bacterium]|jgi:anti-anti-sigma factor